MPKFSPVERVVTEGVEPDYEGFPVGHYTGRGYWQEQTGPSGPFLEPGPARFLVRPDVAVSRAGPGVRAPRSATATRNYRRSDERIYDDVGMRLTSDGNLDASEIEVRVEDGVVTLDGWVDGRDAREYAEDLVLEIAGVVDVLNRLHVHR